MNAKNLLLSVLFYFIFEQVHTSLDILTTNQSLKDGDVLVSKGGNFALGFFSPSNSSNHRYVGIWYNKVPDQTVVWVANRNRPINDSSGMLSLSPGGALIISVQNRSTIVWSTNITSLLVNNVLARLLDTGNFVVTQNLSGNISWQSFDYPSDTMLPFMKLGLDRRTGLNRFLTSWKSQDDPVAGNCSYRIDTTGYPQLFLYKGGDPLWRAGSWMGERWSGVPEMTRNFIFNVSFINSEDEVSITYGITNTSIFSRMVLEESGFVQRSTWRGQDKWVQFWTAPKEQCDYYKRCGPNSNCDPYSNAAQFECKCLPGFEPASPADWDLRDGSGGCKRRQGASLCQDGEGFVKLPRVKVPDTSKTLVNMELSLKECEQNCLKNCSCTAYASAEDTSGGSGCLAWYGDLLDTRTFSNAGQDLYVRVDAIDLGSLCIAFITLIYWKAKIKGVTYKKAVLLAVLYVSSISFFLYPTSPTRDLVKISRYSKKKGPLSQKALVAVVVASVFFLLCISCWLFMKKRKEITQRSKRLEDTSIFTEDDLDGNGMLKSDIPVYDLSTIAIATDNFSEANKLGHGGFGSVYKGVLGSGKEIAVKRLAKYSGQGIEEFKNEVVLIAKLQHRNLVKILGWCTKDGEKMLIYEYLPNKSLDFYIFDETKSSMLDWKIRFEIAKGVARGLLYLHQDSRLRIIHRDLKASNVLLDEALNPKISDFGMARICGGDQIAGDTNRVVGTYGYMSPEYAMAGKFSIKSDAYSFGVLLLEIISGKRNSSCFDDDPSSNLVSHVWDLWSEGKCLDVVEKLLVDDSNVEHEIYKCIQIGLLCVQEFAIDRPMMSEVVFMLCNDVVLPSPKKPAFMPKRNHKDGQAFSTSEGASSHNDVSITMVEPR